jgi:predicted phosphodiesterase
MTVIRFIGDIHGKYLPYLELTYKAEKSIQVGDFGFGFGTLGAASYVDSMIERDRIIQGNHRMIRGNHDKPAEAMLSKYFIKDGTIEIVDGYKIMFIGGAASIDYMYRTEGVSWWRDEELSYEELENLIKIYEEEKPDILITHECPEFFAKDVMIPLVGGISDFKSRTRDALEEMYKIHSPKIHIFGHWHINLDFKSPLSRFTSLDGYSNTRFICLNELCYLDLDFSNLNADVNIMNMRIKQDRSY